MKLTPLFSTQFLARKNRFVLVVKLKERVGEYPEGKVIEVYNPNTGRMTSLLEDAPQIWISKSENPARKYAFTAEIAQGKDFYALINTHRANTLFAEAVQKGKLFSSQGSLIPEPCLFGAHRLDFLWKRGEYHCYVEIKNVTMKVAEHLAAFPDAPTLRGGKHLEILTQLARNGVKAKVCFLVSRTDCQRFRIAKEIDPYFFAQAQKAKRAGVAFEAYRLEITPQEKQTFSLRWGSALPLEDV